MVAEKKTLSTTVNFDKESDIYSADKKTTIKRFLEERYVGKCFDGILVKGISDNIVHGPLAYMNNDLTARVRCDVYFEVEGERFVYGEIIPGWTVTTLSEQIIAAVNENLNGYIEGDKSSTLIKLLQVGKKFPFVVKDASYPSYDSRVTVNLEPLRPLDKQNIIWGVTDKISSEEETLINEALIQLHLVEESYESIPESQRKNFAALLYPYTTVFKFSDLVGSKYKQINFNEIRTIKMGHIIVSPVEDYLNKDFSIYYTNERVPVTAKATVYHILIDCIERRKLFLSNIIRLCKYYDTPDKFTSDKTYWQTFNKIKGN